MDTKVFHYFTELARVKNYSRAAKTLYISPQGLSSSIKRLEGQLGVSLIEADGKGVRLTEYGEIFRKYAQDLSMEIDGMEREIDDLRRHNSGSLKFAVSIGLFNVFPRAAIDDFNESADATAHIESVKTMLDDDCEQSLLDKTSDFALLNDPIDHSVFSSIPLHKDMMFLWMKKDDALAAKDFLTMDDLTGKTISCLASREFKTSRGIESILAKPPYNCTILHTDEVVETLEVAMQRHAYALTVRTHAQAFRHEGYLGIPIRNITWGFGAVWRTDRVLNPQDEEFLSFLKGYQKFYC